MEAGDAGTRQSATPTPSRLDHHHHHHRQHQHHQHQHQHQRQHQRQPSHPPPSSHHHRRDPVDRPYLDQPAMAAATVLAPSAHYPSQSSYPSGYPHQHQPPPSGPSVANMMTPEPRRPSDESESSSTRQSLPSISEVISGARPGQYPPPAHHPSLQQPGASLPSPFASAARQYPEADKHASPQSLHPPSTFPPRQDAHPAFSDSPRPPFNGRPGLPPVSDRRPTPPTKQHDVPPPHHMHEPQKPSEPRPMNGAYAQPPPPPPPTSVPYQPGQLPPGQQPLPSYQVSPRHAPSHVPAQYDSRAPPAHFEDADYAARARFEQQHPRPFVESWSYQEALTRIGSCSRTVFNFAEAYTKIAQEQHGSHPIPERLPTEREVADMLANVDFLKRSLDQVREVVLASIQSERSRESKVVKGPYEEDPDVQMYGDTIKPQYGIAEVKKRRGRAAPPGRCHSCNRIDTPEWRRGPDGARTLCNACGLHYAKLERKRQLEARSLRPKPDERG